MPMTDNSTLISGALIAAAILLHGYWASRGETYQLSAAGNDGTTVWRMNTKSGQISMCGSIVGGAALSQLRNDQDAQILAGSKNPSQETRQQIIEQAGNIHTLSGARCTEWTEY
jgi:hypothetical protein